MRIGATHAKGARACYHSRLPERACTALSGHAGHCGLFVPIAKCSLDIRIHGTEVVHSRVAAMPKRLRRQENTCYTGCPFGVPKT